MDKVQVTAWITRDVNRRLRAELAMRELKFSSWVEEKARAELEAVGEPAAEAVMVAQ
jgi:hypothetical protein